MTGRPGFDERIEALEAGQVTQDTAIATAQSSADAAQSSADAAQSSADAAQSSADAAQSSADAAQSSADAKLPLSGGMMTGSIGTTFDGSPVVVNHKDGVEGAELFLMPRHSSKGYNGWAILRSWRTNGSYCDLTIKPNTSELIFNNTQVRTRAGVLEQIYYGDNPSAFVMPWDGFVICGLRGAGTPAYIYLNGTHWYSFRLPDQGYGSLYMPCTIYISMGVTVSFGGGSIFAGVRIVRL